MVGKSILPSGMLAGESRISSPLDSAAVVDDVQW